MWTICKIIIEYIMEKAKKIAHVPCLQVFTD